MLCLGVATSLGEELESIPPPESNRVTSAEMMQREIERRRETVFTLNEMLDLAERLYRSGEWEQAKRKYELVFQQTDSEGSLSGFHRRAQVGIAQTLAAMAFAREKDGKLAEAAGLMQQAADQDPGNARVAKEAARFQEKAARQANPFPDNSAATADLIAKTSQIKAQLALADQYTETGQYLEANAALEDVLRVDPYHRVARQKMEKLEDLRMTSANKRLQASRQKALAQVTEAWLPPPPAVVDPGRKRSTSTATASQAAAILKALSSIRIPEIVFNEKPIRDAVQELQRLSEQFDPEKKGLNFVLRLPPPAEGRDPEAATVSLELRDISLQTAIKYLCEQVRGGEKLRMEVEDSAVFLLPATETGGDLETRSYNLPPSLLANLGGGPREGGEKGEELTPAGLGEKVLQNIGVSLLAGSSATCFRDTGKLVVRNTPNELNKVEQRIRDAQGEPPQKQFQVEAKFLQFSENDLKNFTFNLQMNGNAVVPGPGTPGQTFNAASSSGGTDGLRGAAGLNQNGVSVVALQSLLDPTYPQDVSNQIGLNTLVFGRGFSAILQALQNAIGRDLVAAPRVTLADGQESKITISRQMYYPTSYTQPTVPNNDQGEGAGFILPSNPTGFEPRNIGVTLNVKGESTSIPRAVDLDFMKLEVEDFEGFIDYGAQIGTVSFGESPSVTGSATTVNPVPVPVGQAPFLVPIFSKRSLQTRVRLLDGETVGIGGLISESVQAVDDKVPGLGDLPLVGRLFRSEASQKIKLNLVIFCTLRIVNPDGSLRFAEDDTNPAYAQNQGEEMMPSVP